jgi:hypothetical protein
MLLIPNAYVVLYIKMVIFLGTFKWKSQNYQVMNLTNLKPFIFPLCIQIEKAKHVFF